MGSSRGLNQAICFVVVCAYKPSSYHMTNNLDVIDFFVFK